jgi:hypothetical protein
VPLVTGEERHVVLITRGGNSVANAAKGAGASGEASSAPIGDLRAEPKDALARAGINVRPIPRLGVDSPDALRQAIRGNAGPMLLRGLTDAWPARNTWIPEHLKNALGQREVTALMDLPAEGVLYPQDQSRYERAMKLADFIDAMMTATQAAPCYLAYVRAAELFDVSECRFAELLGSADGHETDTRAWIGSAGTRSMLHSDLKENLFCQIWGQKTVTLLPWRDSAAAYPFPDNLVNSQVDIAHPDLKRFPRLRDVTFFCSTVQPGDVVYIPRGCWHDIRSLTPSVSVNHWFGPAQSVTQYLALLGRLGPRYWVRTTADFMSHGLLKRPEETRFFFSPASTGKRFYDAIRFGNFSSGNDPAE